MNNYMLNLVEMKDNLEYDGKRFLIYLNNQNGHGFHGFQLISLRLVPIAIRKYHPELYNQIIQDTKRWCVQNLQSDNDTIKQIAILILKDKIQFNQINFPE